MNPRALMDLINEYTPGKKVPIGKIETKWDTSIFDVGKSWAKDVVEILKGADFEGQPVKVEFAREGAVSKERPRREGSNRERPERENSGNRKKTYSGSKRPKKW